MNFRNPDIFVHALWLILLLSSIIAWSKSKRNKVIYSFIKDKKQWKILSSLNIIKRRWKIILFISALFFIFISLARPWWGTKLVKTPKRSRDLLVLLDTSKSMLAKDVAPTRLKHAKWILSKLLDACFGDRFGLIAFAGDSFLECPLTQNKDSFMLFLNDADTNTIPIGGTNIGNALNSALEAFKAAEGGHRAVILLTDGDELEGDSAEILDKLKSKNIPVFVMGIGDPDKPGSGIIQLQNNSILKDKNGNIIKSVLNEAGLKRIAIKTGGIYVRSTSIRPNIQPIINRIKRLIPKTNDSATSIRPIERYQFFLLLTIILLFGRMFLGERKRQIKLFAYLFSFLFLNSFLTNGQNNSNQFNPNIQVAPSRLAQNRPSASPHQEANLQAPQVSKEEGKRIQEAKDELLNIKDNIKAEEAKEKKNKYEIARLYYNASRLHMDLNQPKKAEEKLQKVIELSGDNKELKLKAYQNLGAVKQKLARNILPSDPDKAIELMKDSSLMNREALRIEPSNKEIINNQELLINDLLTAKEFKKIKKIIEKLQQKALQETKQALANQQKSNSDIPEKKQYIYQNNANKRTKDAIQTCENLQNVLKHLKQNKAEKRIKEAQNELNSSKEKQEELFKPINNETKRKNKVEIAKHLYKAYTLLGGQPPQKDNKKKRKSKKDKKDNKKKQGKKKKQTDKSSKENKKGQKNKGKSKESLADKLNKAQKNAEKKEKKQEKEKDKTFDKKQAIMLLQRMQKKEQNLRDKIKEAQMKNRKYKKVEKDW